MIYDEFISKACNYHANSPPQKHADKFKKMMSTFLKNKLRNNTSTYGYRSPIVVEYIFFCCTATIFIINK